MLHEEFRQALEDGDVGLSRKLAAHVFPHLPQPKTDYEAELTMHMARTSSEALSFKARAWSHHWLTERNYPSHLPDDLKPYAERRFPRIVEGVGIMVRAGSPERVPLAIATREAMETVVNEMYAEGDRDPVLVKSRMMEARRRVLRS